MFRRALISIGLLCILFLGGSVLAGCGTTKVVQPQPTTPPTSQLYVGLHTANWEVRVRIEPLRPGNQPATLTLKPHEGAIPEGTALALELSHADGTGAQRFEAKPVGDGTYKIDAVPLSAGSWKLRAYVTAPGASPESAGYEFTVPAQ